MNFKINPKNMRRLAATALLLAAGCSNDTTTPTGTVSAESENAAMDQGKIALQTTRALNNEQLVEDLTGGFEQGLAGEAAGIEMEFGSELPDLNLGVAEYTLGARLAQSRRSHPARAARAPQIAGKDFGDLLYQDTEENFDGSITVISVYQDAPESVVRVEAVSTWPQGNLLLTSSTDEVVIDRGADYESEADDIWFSFRSKLEFTWGAELERVLDARAQGGFQDNLQVPVVSTFKPRANHPRLLDQVTTLVVDLQLLEVDNDELFVSVDRITRFKGQAHDGGQPRVVESLEPSSPVAEGEEPCGGSASRAVSFDSKSPLVDWTDQIDWACDDTGTVSRTVNYSDDTTDSLSLSRAANGIVTLQAADRDGSTATGSFDEAAGTFTVSKQCPAGSDPVGATISGQSNADGTQWSLDEEIEYADGFMERNHLEGSETADRRELSGYTVNRDGRTDFSLASNLEETVFEGMVSNDQGESLEFRVETLADGGYLLDFVAEDATARVEGHFAVDAAGCGEGTLIIDEGENHAEIKVTFCENEMQDDTGRLTRSL